VERFNPEAAKPFSMTPRGEISSGNAQPQLQQQLQQALRMQTD